MDSNPYSAPQATVAEASGYRLAIEPAGRGRRFLNMLIDYAGFMSLAMLLGIGIALVAGDETLAAWEQPNALRDYAFGAFVYLLYYVPLEGLFGLTLGKLVTGTRVVNEKGEPPSWGQVFGRTLCRFIPFEPFSVLFGEERRGWHDSVPRTYVVRKKR